MKKSLLGKLLAGVMSLGMLSGGNFASNSVMAVYDYEDENDEGVECVDDKQLNENDSNSGVGGLRRGTCLAFDFIPGIGPVWGHIFAGTLGEDLTSRVTTIATALATSMAVQNEDILMTEKERNAYTIISTIDKGGILQFNKNGDLIDNDKQIFISKDQLDLFKKAKSSSKNGNGDLVDDNGNVLIPKDKYALIKSADHKAIATMLAPLALHHLGWLLYDVFK